MSVYVIASLTIKDAVRFEDYRRMLLPTMAKYDARLVARGGPIVLEGGEDLVACWDSSYRVF
jgi:uncharacterized protein (DUF1330 family)